MKKQNLINLYTEEGEKLTGQPWNVYPRPQMVRDSFLCLNGQWRLGDNDKITVPFVPESLLSGINKRQKRLCVLNYFKEFTLPKDFMRGRVLLHFGAISRSASIRLNGHDLCEHHGGYTPITVDITEYLEKTNTLDVLCVNSMFDQSYPYGKQRSDRGGMWYTPASGIWQTVWLESVPETYIKKLDIEAGKNHVHITAHGVDDGTLTLCGKDYPLHGGRCYIQIEEPHMWSPDDPYLYHFTVTAGEDKVSSYFALRTIETKEIDGVARLCLNGKPFFFHGLLDQGYYSDGIFTPASPKCYENDILTMKSLGFNTLRKHIKIEPEQFYYDCDRLGMVVFQDMVNNGDYSFLRDTALPTLGFKKRNDKKMHKDEKSRKRFTDAMVETVELLKNHPCICYWTIFNEGWGQFNGSEMYEKLKNLDSSRPIDTASGWFYGCESDIESPHIYFKPFIMPKSEKPVVLSEFGGYAYKIPEHSFNLKKTYGYKKLETKEEFNAALENLYRKEIIPAAKAGLSGAIYTQVSDVEDETNGLLTYDRKVLKADREIMLRIAEELK
ncbi:MAG: glycoside hydrolase family 2 [Clostridia bacterium]|nr:glycoside hydrolase family 2 [Clostridia bacterium]